MSGKNIQNISYLEGLYVYGSGEMDQLKPLNENVEEEKQIFQSAIPRKIPLHFINDAETIKTVKCGQVSTIILSTQGNVYTFGCSDNGGIGHEDSFSVKRVPLKFAAEGVSGGDAHGIAYNRNNLAFWGQFKSSKKWLGKPCYEPTYFSDMHINGDFYKKAISGTNHVIILSEQKNVYAFGCNEYGQIGVSPSKIFHHFQVNKLYEKNVEDIFTGDEHSFLTKYEGGIKVLKAWGCNCNGQLGIGSYATKVNENYSIYVPTKVVFEGISKISVKKVDGGSSTSICLTDDNRVFVWGLNDFHQLGLNSKEKIIPRPKEIHFFNPKENPNNTIDEIYANNQFFYSKNNSTNKVYSWGVGDNFVLGNRKEESENTPYLINHLFFKNLFVNDLSLGSAHVSVYLTEKENINKTRSRSTSQKKLKKKDEENNKKNIINNSKKPIKRKNEKLPTDEIEIKIKEEYITLHESDQPKSSAKKIYIDRKSIEKIDIDENINKITEQEKEKSLKLENMMSSKNQHKINLENDTKKSSDKSKSKSKMEKEKEKTSSKKNEEKIEKINIEQEEKEEKKSKSNNNRKKSIPKKETAQNEKKNNNNTDVDEEGKKAKKDSQSKSQRIKANSKRKEKDEEIDIESDEKEEKKEKASSKKKSKKSKDNKEEIQKEKENKGKNTPKSKSKNKNKISLSNKEKEKEKEERIYVTIEEEKKEKAVRKSSRNKSKKNEDEEYKEDKQNDKKSKKSKKSKEESDNDENSENNSGKKYSYPKKVKTPDKNQGKSSRSKQGSSRDKSQKKNKSKSKSKEKYPKKK